MRKVRKSSAPGAVLSGAPGEMGAVVVSTRGGWCGVAGDEQGVALVTLGQPSRAAAEEDLQRRGAAVDGEASSIVRDAAEEIARYLAGEPVDLAVFPVYGGRQTEFQRRVVRALRQVGYGEVVSYGELAARVEAPRAARAVGTVMAHNPTPLLVPCHRVIASQGKLGGFSAPQGIALKRALLALEQGETAALEELGVSRPRRASRTRAAAC